MIVKSGYGLLHKESDSLLGVYSQSDDGGDSIGTYYTLSTSQEPLWIVKNNLIASYVRLNSTEWYNAGFETPINPYEPEELDVVSIELKCDVVEPYPVPTYEEFLRRKYLTEGLKSYNPDWYNHIMKERKMWGHHYTFSLYDLQDLVGEY